MMPHQLFYLMLRVVRINTNGEVSKMRKWAVASWHLPVPNSYHVMYLCHETSDEADGSPVGIKLVTSHTQAILFQKSIYS
jgi:hypothetical protein